MSEQAAATDLRKAAQSHIAYLEKAQVEITNALALARRSAQLAAADDPNPKHTMEMSFVAMGGTLNACNKAYRVLGGVEETPFMIKARAYARQFRSVEETEQEAQMSSASTATPWERTPAAISAGMPGSSLFADSRAPSVEVIHDSDSEDGATQILQPRRRQPVPEREARHLSEMGPSTPRMRLFGAGGRPGEEAESVEGNAGSQD